MKLKTEKTFIRLSYYFTIFFSLDLPKVQSNAQRNQMPVNRIKFYNIVIIWLTFYTTNSTKATTPKSHRLSVCVFAKLFTRCKFILHCIFRKFSQRTRIVMQMKHNDTHIYYCIIASNEAAYRWAWPKSNNWWYNNDEDLPFIFSPFFRCTV